MFSVLHGLHKVLIWSELHFRLQLSVLTCIHIICIDKRDIKYLYLMKADIRQIS